jgi:hypothetical protein
MPFRWESTDDTVYTTMQLVDEFIDIWLQTRKPEDIDCGELAGVIDVLYETQPSPGGWVLVRMDPQQLKDHIREYIRDDGTRAPMMRKRDVAFAKAYVGLMTKGHESTPIMVMGAENPKTGEKGLALIDGRHRIHAHVMAKRPEILVYIPADDVRFLEETDLAGGRPSVARKKKKG